MYPTKNTIDYTLEINKLFQSTNENDIFDTQTNSLLSPFNNSTVNRSSSSTDSISPKSLHDISPRGFVAPSVFNQREFMTTETDSPSKTHRHRPIIGRRLMASDQTPILREENSNYFNWDLDVSIWQPSEVFPKALNNNIFTENGNKPNAFYELFPENRTSLDSSNISPSRMTNSPNSKTNTSSRITISPNNMTNSPRGMSNSSSCTNVALLEPLIPNPCQTSSVISTPMFGPSCSNKAQVQAVDTGKICTFCRKNGETPLVYTTHLVKQRVGNKQVVTCPILRSHVCSTCGGTGDQAHTITYCPVLRNSNNGQPLLSTTITLKNTRVKSNGRRRY